MARDRQCATDGRRILERPASELPKEDASLRQMERLDHRLTKEETQMTVSSGLTCASCTRSLKSAAFDPLLAQTG
jgi:hypothetical protein